MHRQEGLIKRRSGLGLSCGGGNLAYWHRGCAGLAAHRSAWRLSLGHGPVPALLGSSTPQCPVRPTFCRGPVSNNAPQRPAATSREGQQHQQDTTPQAPASSPTVQELLKRLARANSATVVVKELSEWRETAPEGQQQDAAAVVGAAALQDLTRVLGPHPGAKLHQRQREELQVCVIWRVAGGAGAEVLWPV